MLSEEERERYARSLSILGEEGQQALRRGRVLVIGAGGVGSAALLYLAAAGVGTIAVADGDRVERSNLQRQIIHTADRLGGNKARSAARAMAARNPGVQIRVIPEYVSSQTLPALARRYDFVIDGADGLETKLMISDSCVAAGVPFCHCGTQGLRFQVMTCLPGRSPCVRCAFGHPAGSVSGSTLGPACGCAGSVAAAEAIKYLTGRGELLTGRLFTADLMTMESRMAPLRRDPGCPACGESGQQ